MGSSEITVISARPEGVVLARGGAVVGIRRAPLRGAVLDELHDGFQRVFETQRHELAVLSVYRLSPYFPLTHGFDANTRDLSDVLRCLDRAIGASASVLEFGGVRAAAMRLATHAVLRLARPKGQFETFDRVMDGIGWLLPRGERLGVAADASTYLGLYRGADAMLGAMDLDAADAR